jgi:hypothetical protein
VATPSPDHLITRVVATKPIASCRSGKSEDDQQRVHMRELCPGTPITFTTYRRAARTRVHMQMAGFQLPELSKGTVTLRQSQ